MDHVGQGVSVFLALTHHPRNIVPRVPIVLHRFDNFDNCVHIGDVFFNVLSLEFVNVLFFLELSYSFILVLFDLVVLFPRDSLNIFFFLMLILFVMLVILRDCLIKGCELFTALIRELDVFVGRKLKILQLLFLFFRIGRLLIKQIPLVFRVKVGFEEIKAYLSTFNHEVFVFF